MKQILDRYYKSISEWNAKHRIVGRSPPRTLVDESMAALKTLGPELSSKCLVDVGAGAGILGVPWILLNPGSKCAFVEPDLKKAAFLRYWLSTEPTLSPRCMVLSKALEDVSRETIQEFAQEGAFCAVRAFSGARALGDCIKKSALKSYDFYIFETEPLSSAPFVLKKLDI